MAYSSERLQLAFQQTAAETGFAAPLIEKDYYCSLVLKEIFSNPSHDLVFKGGTLLNKVHVGFYRLSEDLDFSISVSASATRNDRSKLMKSIKATLEKFEDGYEGLSLASSFKGYNDSSQYNACIEYNSDSTLNKGTILFEIGLREEILIEPLMLEAKTLVRDPINNALLIDPYPVRCLTKIEAYAEKLRAALTRKKPAIRDLFDLDYAIAQKIIDINDAQFQVLAKIKLTKPDLLEIDLSDTKKQILTTQLEAQLRPVLREQDYERFDFEKAWTGMIRVAEQLVLANSPHLKTSITKPPP